MPLQQDNWTKMLSKYFNRQHINYAQAGSSLLYSTNCFFRYIETDYRQEDYIVFVTTSHFRAPKLHSNLSPRHCFTLKEFVDSELDHGRAFIKFDRMFAEPFKYWSQQPQVVTYLAHVLCNQEDFRHQILLIESYLKNLINKTLLLNAFDVDEYKRSETHFILSSVAGLEHLNWVGSINHMETRENMILAEQCKDYFNTNDYSVFNLAPYRKKISSTDIGVV